MVKLNYCLNKFCRKYKVSRLNEQNTRASNNVDKESKYTTGPKSTCTNEKNTTMALSYEEPVQHKPLSCAAALEQPLYEDIDVSHNIFWTKCVLFMGAHCVLQYLQKNIETSPNVGYEQVAISRM